MGTIISVLISLIAYECSNFPFDTIFFYISTAIGVYEFFLHLQKKYKKRRKKTQQNTNDVNSKSDKTDTTSVNNP